MRFLLCVLSVLFLTACGAEHGPAWEYVSDGDAIQQVSYTEPYNITVFVPADTLQAEENPAYPAERYIHKDGHFSICTRNILGTDARLVIEQICGMPYENLTVIETRRFGLPEYRFSWFEDGLCCRGDVIQDGDVFYTVVVSIQEDMGSTYNHLPAQVFASIGLNGSEI